MKSPNPPAISLPKQHQFRPKIDIIIIIIIIASLALLRLLSPLIYRQWTNDHQVKPCEQRFPEQHPSNDNGTFGIIMKEAVVSTIDIVIAHYHEEIEKLNHTASVLYWAVCYGKPSCMARVTVYTKSHDVNIIGRMRKGIDLPHVQIVQLPNIGRESHSYLQHIVNNYDCLSDHTLFAQADSHNLTSLVVPRLHTLFNHEKTGYIYLSHTSPCNCAYGCMWPGIMIGVRDIFHMATQKLCNHQSFLMNNNAQFAVSRKRILDKPKSMYQSLIDAFNPSETNPILKNHEFLGFSDAAYYSRALYRNSNGTLKDDLKWATDPLFGHTMERMWTVIFDCYNMSLVKGCAPCEGDSACMDPDLVPGCQPDCAAGECQCLDE